MNLVLLFGQEIMLLLLVCCALRILMEKMCCRRDWMFVGAAVALAISFALTEESMESVRQWYRTALLGGSRGIVCAAVCLALKTFQRKIKDTKAAAYWTDKEQKE